MIRIGSQSTTTTTTTTLASWIPFQSNKDNNNNKTTECHRWKASELERILTRRLRIDDDDDNENDNNDEFLENDPAVVYGIRYDAHWLKCHGNGITTTNPPPLVTLLGILEDEGYDVHVDCSIYVSQQQQYQQQQQQQQEEKDTTITDTKSTTSTNTITTTSIPPKMGSDWKRLDKPNDWLYQHVLHQQETLQTKLQNYKTMNSALKLQWIDLRPLLLPKSTSSSSSKKTTTNTKGGGGGGGGGGVSLSLETSADCYILLQSILGWDHSSSPWVVEENNNNNTNDLFDICILVVPSIDDYYDNNDDDDDDDDDNDSNDNGEDDYDYDKTAVSLLRNFRVSDAAPSWFLHSILECDTMEEHGQCLFQPNTTTTNTNANTTTSTSIGMPDSTSCKPATLFVYKRLKYRPGFLQNAQQNFESSVTTNTTNNDTTNNDTNTSPSFFPGCLLETILPEPTDTSNEKQQQEQQQKQESSSDPESIITRLQCPPYLDLSEIYPRHVYQTLFEDQHILEIITQEALQIPQWTPWPETHHYSSSSNGNHATWTVFPLCYCFPAHDVSKRTWVEQTKQYCPQTCQILLDTVGPYLLRTALFSQLQPNTTLEAHSGWADLANHVLRLHIPLIVPTIKTTVTTTVSDKQQEEQEQQQEQIINYNVCGTWVDGCVEWHRIGHPILFDDSKIHRAFNYHPTESRIVLIVDLERPNHNNHHHDNNNNDFPPAMTSLPLGYATGGHSEELDAFIQQMSVPK